MVNNVENLERVRRRLEDVAESAFHLYNLGKIVHHKQIDFHRDSSKSRWVFGGNRTGKTECGAMESLWLVTGMHPYQTVDAAKHGWVVSLSTQVQRDVAQAKILKYLPTEFIKDVVMKSGRRDNPKNGVIDFISVRNKFGDISTLGFKSCDQGREKFQGTSLDFVWFDEEPPEEIYEECLLRTLDTGGIVFGTMTPLKGRTWLFDRIMLGNEHSIHQMSWEDNPFLKSEEIASMERSLSCEQLESRKYGRFSEGSGIVFSEFDEDSTVEPFRIKADEWIVAIDPGYVAPTACVYVARVGEVFYVVADYAVSGKTVEEHAKAIVSKCESLGIPKCEVWGMHTALIDSASVQQNLGAKSSVATQFRNNGLHVDTKVNKHVIDGIMKVKALFRNSEGVRRLYVFKNCVNLIRELRTYSWGDNERPVKKNDHCIDALRYALATERIRTNKREPPSLLEERKRKFIKENHYGN